MYNYLPIICGGILLVLGLFMTICPKQATKKEERENEEAVMKTRKNGYVEIACGAIIIIMGLLFK